VQYCRNKGPKDCFNYLLLDPRLTVSLCGADNNVSSSTPSLEQWQGFVCAIFYVGKGKQKRPMAHLKEARKFADRQYVPCKSPNAKILHILDIWSNDLGVVSLPIFQHLREEQALAREAAIIDAIGVNNLSNEIRGHTPSFPSSSWPLIIRRKLGIALLHRALRIFLTENEKQIRVTDF